MNLYYFKFENTNILQLILLLIMPLTILQNLCEYERTMREFICTIKILKSCIDHALYQIYLESKQVRLKDDRFARHLWFFSFARIQFV